MAYYRCGSSGGGAMKETVLWQNPSPTTQISSSVIYNGDISDYDFIKLAVRVSTGDATESYVLCPVEDILKNEGWQYCVRASNGYLRYFNYDTTNNNLTISSGYPVNTSGINNNRAIPTKISGIKL